jgi:PPK2 family polyphosphate:nucleotide phosphotransferase
MAESGNGLASWSTPAFVALRASSVTDLAVFDTRAMPGFTADRGAGERLLVERSRRLAGLQELLFANGRSGDRRSVLLILQGMDTAGKGGVVRHVVGSVDPQGVDHAAFGVPTVAEKRHHFLWRVAKQLPRPGQLGVFDRSHYEDVLVPVAHRRVSSSVVQRRYRDINEFEAELVESGTTLVKVTLVISPAEQARRLRDRLQRPDKYWKYDPHDLDDRRLWSDYVRAYQAMLRHTDTPFAPWYVVPADRKWFARLAVTELLIHALEQLDLTWPAPTFDVAAELRRLDAETR